MDSANLVGFGMIIMILSAISFIIGIIMAIASQKNRKAGIKLIIGSIIAFIIGFGTCAANFSLGGH